MTLNFADFRLLTFDCYGTLIDWEGGILPVLKGLLTNHQVILPDQTILEVFAEAESLAEAGDYVNYHQILQKVVIFLAEKYHFSPSETELNCLADSIQYWLPFSDTVQALRLLKTRYKLAIISNIDDALLQGSLAHLQVDFDGIITAQQVKSYKPSLNNFNHAIARLGVEPGEILHIAQSIYHDIIPAQSVGLKTVWVNRRQGKTGAGATPVATAQPDLEVPDLQSLVQLIETQNSQIFL